MSRVSVLTLSGNGSIFCQLDGLIPVRIATREDYLETKTL